MRAVSRPDVTAESLLDFLEANARRKADAPALGRIVAGELAWTPWGAVLERVRHAAGRLADAGVGAGDIVAHCGQNSAAWIANDLALQSLRAVALPLSPSGLDGSPIPLTAEQRARLLAGELIQVGTLPPELNAATLTPTSGTSGRPLGVLLTRQNLLSNAVAVSDAVVEPIDGDGQELRLAFLPFTHLYARVCDLYAWLYRGSRLVLAESRESMFRDLRLVRPTSINGVPYFYQKALDLAERQREPLRDVLGGAVRQCFCGGAALSPELQREYAEQGVPLMSGYGLSEASPVVAASRRETNRIGTVGRPLAGVEVRIANDGEILVRGAGLMIGYYEQEAATAAAVRDGWLHTGDLGSLDAEGHLVVDGRKKETLVLSTGKNASPARLEALLCASPWIEQACVVGDGRKHLAALIVPNPDRVRALVRGERLWVFSRRGALAHRRVRERFAEEVARTLATCEPHEQIRRFALLPRGFSIERDEMTAKLSLRRRVIAEHFECEIESLYR